MRLMIAVVLCITMIMNVGCQVGKVLSQDVTGGGQTYDFRRSRWGDLKAKVKFSERGIHPTDYGRVLIYKTKFHDVPVELIYTFDEDNRLRAAGYLVKKPVHNVDHIARYAVDLHGMPDDVINGLTWRTNRSLVYWEAIVADAVLRKYKRGGGALAHLIGGRKSGPIPTKWVGVWGYMDVDFLERLTGDKYPLDNLTHHEERLFGALTPRAGVRYRGTTLPDTR